MPLEFFELPQGAPSVNVVDTTSTAVAYCTASDVASLNMARAQGLGVAGQPTLANIQGYIVMVAGAMDAIMLNKGYQVPVSAASFPEVAGFLSWVNAQGAAWMWEVSSPAPNTAEIDRLRQAYDSAVQMLTDGKFAMDIPSEKSRAGVRAPFITYQPTGRYYDPTLPYGRGDGISGANAPGGCRRDPYFTRNIHF